MNFDHIGGNQKYCEELSKKPGFLTHLNLTHTEVFKSYGKVLKKKERAPNRISVSNIEKMVNKLKLE
jgi:hypothetical protein